MSGFGARTTGFGGGSSGGNAGFQRRQDDGPRNYGEGQGRNDRGDGWRGGFGGGDAPRGDRGGNYGRQEEWGGNRRERNNEEDRGFDRRGMQDDRRGQNDRRIHEDRRDYRGGYNSHPQERGFGGRNDEPPIRNVNGRFGGDSGNRGGEDDRRSQEPDRGGYNSRPQGGGGGYNGGRDYQGPQRQENGRDRNEHGYKGDERRNDGFGRREAENRMDTRNNPFGESGRDTSSRGDPRDGNRLRPFHDDRRPPAFDDRYRHEGRPEGRTSKPMTITRSKENDDFDGRENRFGTDYAPNNDRFDGNRGNRNNYEDREQQNRGGFDQQNRRGFNQQNRGGFNQQNRGGFNPDHGHRNDNFSSQNFEQKRYDFSSQNDYPSRGGFRGGREDEPRGGFNSGSRGGFNGGGFNKTNEGNGFASRGGRGGFGRQSDSGGFSRTAGTWENSSMHARAPKEWIPEEKDLEEMYDDGRAQVDAYTDLEQVQVKGNEDKRFNTWANSGLYSVLIDILLNKRGFTSPRPIQAATIPQVLQGYDVVTKAETGSGKTLAFVLPILDYILRAAKEGRRNFSPLAVILEPTRELADQVYNEFRMMIAGTGVNVVLNYGQIAQRSINLQNVDVYVGTIGRFKDYFERGRVDIGQMKFFVLDEADQMLKRKDMADLGCIFDSAAFKNTNQSRQTMLYSATMNEEAAGIAEQLMRKNKVVSITATGSRANKHIKQVYVNVATIANKTEYLEELFAKEKEENKIVKTLVFVATKSATDTLALQIGDLITGKAESMNGDRPQDVRNAAIKNFRTGKTTVLVATDVCSRGLDIKDLDRVILYDVPNKTSDIETALDILAHRIGRTGRVRQGTAIIFIDSTVRPEMAKGLVQMVKEVGQEPPAFLENLANGSGGGSFGSFGNKFGGDDGSFGREEGKGTLDSWEEDGRSFTSSDFTKSSAPLSGFGNEETTGFGSSFERNSSVPTSGFDGSGKEAKKEDSSFGSKGSTSSNFDEVLSTSGFGGGKKKEESSQFGTTGFGQLSTESTGFGEEKKEDNFTTSRVKKEEEKTTAVGLSGFGTGYHKPAENTTLEESATENSLEKEKSEKAKTAENKEESQKSDEQEDGKVVSTASPVDY